MKKLLVITALAGLAATARAQVGPIMVPKEKGEALLPWGLECPNSFECEERQSPGRLPVEAGCRHKTAKKYVLPAHYPRPGLHATEKLIISFFSELGSGGTGVYLMAYIIPKARPNL
jgi:hypothetical protein